MTTVYAPTWERNLFSLAYEAGRQVSSADYGTNSEGNWRSTSCWLYSMSIGWSPLVYAIRM
jgi:hypothetical protein